MDLGNQFYFHTPGKNLIEINWPCALIGKLYANDVYNVLTWLLRARRQQKAAEST